MNKDCPHTVKPSKDYCFLCRIEVAMEFNRGRVDGLLERIKEIEKSTLGKIVNHDDNVPQESSLNTALSRMMQEAYQSTIKCYQKAVNDVNNKNGWIRPFDKLPEVSGNYLVYDKRNGLRVYNFQISETWEWREKRGNEFCYICPSQVIYWQKLPSIPL